MANYMFILTSLAIFLTLQYVSSKSSPEDQSNAIKSEPKTAYGQSVYSLYQYLFGWNNKRYGSGSYESCHDYHYGPQYDSCERRCKCVNGKLKDCARIRKEFTSMSVDERRRYVKAVKKASTEEPFKTEYQKIIREHKRLFFRRIHEVHEFLPWHRWYILQYENLLRKIDCRITVPYWDWSLWAHDPWNSNHVWHPGHRGLGGNGTGSDRCVRTGPFRTQVWKQTNNQCLTRNFNGVVPDAAEVQFCLSLKKFDEFELYLRGPLHDNVHCRIGATMCSTDAAEDPVFFFHHGFIDKIWEDWQKKKPENRYAYFPGLSPEQKMQGTNYYPDQFLELDRQPTKDGYVNVRYDEPTVNNAAKVKKYLSRTC